MGDVADAIVQAESGGNPTAQNPSSSAGGAGQFIDSTWLNVMNKYRPDLTAGKSDADILAMKNDAQLSRDMTSNYASENANYLANKGLPVTAGTTYLAHFAGPAGAAAVLQADPSTPVSVVLPNAMKANPFMKGMTVADLQNWAGRKMGESAGASSAGPSTGGFQPITAARPGAAPAQTLANTSVVQPSAVQNSAPPPAGLLSGLGGADGADFAQKMAAVEKAIAANEQAPQFLPAPQIQMPIGQQLARMRAQQARMKGLSPNQATIYDVPATKVS